MTRLLYAVILSLLSTVALADGRVQYQDFEGTISSPWSQETGASTVTSAADAGAGPVEGSKMGQCNYSNVSPFSAGFDSKHNDTNLKN